MKPINPIPTLDQLEVLYSQLGIVRRNGEQLIVYTSQAVLEFRSRILAWDWWKNHPHQIAQLIQPVEDLDRVLAEVWKAHRAAQRAEKQLKEKVAA